MLLATLDMVAPRPSTRENSNPTLLTSR